MLLAVTLNDIARGDADPTQARALVADMLERASRETLLDLYHALRAWVWKALDQRRRGPELRDWHDIIASSATVTGGSDPSLGAKLDSLQELLSESIAVSAKHETFDVTRRQHVAKALEFLAVHGGAADRERIGAHLGLAQANLTRVLNLMLTAGLLERSACGKRASFRLTRRGVEAAPPMHAPTPADAHIQARAVQRRRAASQFPLDDGTLDAVRRLIDLARARGTFPGAGLKAHARQGRPEAGGGGRLAWGADAGSAGTVVNGSMLVVDATPVFTLRLTSRADLGRQSFRPVQMASGRPEAAVV